MYTAYYETTATATITMDVPDDIATRGPEAIQQWIWEHSPHSVTIGACCSGSGKKDYSLELGDFEPATHDSGAHKGLAYVTGEDGEPVTEGEAS